MTSRPDRFGKFLPVRKPIGFIRGVWVDGTFKTIEMLRAPIDFARVGSVDRKARKRARKGVRR